MKIKYAPRNNRPLKISETSSKKYCFLVFGLSIWIALM